MKPGEPERPKRARLAQDAPWRDSTPIRHDRLPIDARAVWLRAMIRNLEAFACYRPCTTLLVCSVALAATAPFASAIVLPAPAAVDSATPFSPAFVAANTVDGTEAEFATAGLGADTFIEYSFGAPQSFDKIVVLNRDSPDPSDYIADFSLILDGATTVSVTRAPLRGSSEIHSLGALRTATDVRLEVDTIGAGAALNTGAMEVFFVRTPAGQTPISASIFGSAPAFNPFFAADNAVDGIVGRSSGGGADGPEYASASLGADAFVDFDLGMVVPVGGFDYFDRPADEDRVLAYDMIFSINSTFGDADDVVRSYTNSTIGSSDVFAGINAQFVRFDVTANAGANTGVSEMSFYQVPEPSSLALGGLGITLLVRRRR